MQAKIETVEDWRREYPKITEAATEAGIDLRSAFISQVGRFGRTSWLDQVCNALSKLRERRSHEELKEPVRAFFGDIYDRWEQGVTELIGLAWVEQKGMLDQIGWPKGDGSANFEATVKSASGKVVAFDVKTGCAHGVMAVQDDIREAVNAWADSKGLGKQSVSISFPGGELTERMYAPSKPKLRELLKALLDNSGLPNDKALTVAIPPLSFDVRTRPFDGVNSMHGAFPVLPVSITATILGHAKKKAEVGAGKVDSFFILYVRPPEMGGTDITPQGLAGVLPAVRAEVQRNAEAFRGFMGYALLDLNRSDQIAFHPFPMDSKTWDESVGALRS